MNFNHSALTTATTETTSSSVFASSSSLSHHHILDRRKFTNRLYENVIDSKTQDSELMEFYKMVKELRSKYKYDDETTNIGHIIASEIINNQYNEDKSIKILVYPSLEALRGSDNHEDNLQAKQEIQIPGYGSPVVFTCDSKSNRIMLKNFKFFFLPL